MSESENLNSSGNYYRPMRSTERCALPKQQKLLTQREYADFCKERREVSEKMVAKAIRDLRGKDQA